MRFFTEHIFTRAAAAFVALGMTATAYAQTFDLSPEQAGQVRIKPNEKAIAALPADFKLVTPGKLTVGINPWVPPISTYATDAKTIVGFDPDIVKLVADGLGLELVLVPTAWADWPLALQSGKVDAVVSNITVTEARKEKFDFSTYRDDLLGFYVKSDSPINKISEPKDVAGLRIITGAGTTQEKIVQDWDKQNVAAGLAPIELQYYDDDAVRNLAIQSGRADAVFHINSTQAYQARTDGKTKLVGTVNGGWPLTAQVGVTTRKGNNIADAITIVLNGAIESGAYNQILDRWGLADEKVSKSETNPAGLPKT
ncbi:ABC transporter substrate-binding protein [Brucellaceae bacterium C25G]